MDKKISYKSTAIACYIGHFTQAAVINLTPVLFIPIREQFGFSFGQLGTLILINFITQVICDIVFSFMVDKYGFRPFAVISHATCAFGFVIFAAAPVLFPSNEYLGFVIGTIIFSAAGGLLEVLLSPIVNAIPTDEKAAAMSVLHSFYAWGQVAVVLLTTFMLFIFGNKSWPFITLGWVTVPLINVFMFLKVPLASPVPEEDRQHISEIIIKPFFIVAFFAIMFGAATEVTMNQWSSAFMEKALNIPKVIGDTAGMCMFAVFLGIRRLLYGIYGKKINVNKALIAGSFFAILCYLIVALSPIYIISLIACVLCGFCVSLLWPGTLVTVSSKYPLSGSWIFAILAAGGDIGASLGPWLVGIITDTVSEIPDISFLDQSSEQLGLRAGILAASIFPLISLICHKYLKKHSKDNQNQ